MSKHARLYNSPRWKRLRVAQLREEPLCWYCDQMGRVTAADTADHIRAHRGDEGLFFDSGNLQSLCSSCHNSLKQQQEKQGYHCAVGVDGLPVDEGHPWLKQ